MTAPAVTVVVATRNRPGPLAATLDALSAARRPGDEVIVVDSASDPPVPAGRCAAGGARLVRCARPGASRARNAGLAAAGTELVAFTDDDCRPQPGWTAALADAFAAHPEAAFVTGTVRAGAAPGAPPPSLALSVVEGPDRPLERPDQAAGFGHGANMAWRRRALLELGGFDEALGPGTVLAAAEDLDLFLRALRSGRRGWFAAGAVVVHDQWRSPAARLRTYAGYGVGAGALAVKAARVDGAGWPAAVRAVLWADGLAAVGRAAGRRHVLGTAAEAAKTAGAVLGLLRARRLVLTDGRFAAAGADPAGPAVAA